MLIRYALMRVKLNKLRYQSSQFENDDNGIKDRVWKKNRS